MSAEESTSLNIKNNSTNFDNLQKNSEQPTNKKRKRCGPNLNKQQRLKKKMAKMANSSNEPPLDPQIALKNENELLQKKNDELENKLNNMSSKYLNLKKVSYKFGCCIICTNQLNHENVYFLNNCGHKFHHYCIDRWISEEKKTCPCCRVTANLNDIKQFFVEEQSDSSDDIELTQSTSNAVNVVNNLNFAEFTQFKNKWIKNTFSCCSNNCINTNKPIGNCIEGNGSGKVINDENIEYMNCLEEKQGYDRFIYVLAENSFKKPQDCFNYSLFYFQMKCIFKKEEKEKCMICLNDFKTTDSVKLFALHGEIKKEGSESIKIDKFSCKNNDVFGCGIVYPPNNKRNELPYVFFTQNGKQIGKAVLLTCNGDSYRPCIGLERCSVEANFGNNLETKPFIYDISKHSLLKEFY